MKERLFYRRWRAWLQIYGMKKNPDFDVNNYEEEVLQELFSNGLTTAMAYKELLSELPKIVEPEYPDSENEF